MTLRQLAEASGISHAQISRIEAGYATTVKMETVVALAKGLGCGVGELTGQDDDHALLDPSHSTLQDDERALLSIFREMDGEQRYRLLLMLEAFVRADQLREQIAEQRRDAGLEE